MTAERWQQVERIWQEAAAQPPSKREAFLNQACAGDQDLRGEVNRMLSGEAGLSRFMEAPAAEVAAPKLARQRIPAGTRIGPYQIVSLLGAGGMGEVYKARDTRLNRTVAIKVLPQYAARNDNQDDDRRKRLLREARTASVLNHPNIVTIHDILTEGSQDSIVMEYVEGRTLEETIGRKGLPLSEVLQYGIQTAGALAAAHAKGIIHRDLKPGNIMVTKGGIKVLDFGLAKFARTAGTPSPESEMLTAEHAIVGTLCYMAPEQLAGTECDARTDIFALGLVLYETIAGKPAFAGATREALIAEVMRCQPAALENAPPLLVHVVGRCLAREPAERWQSASDLRAALELAAIPLAETPVSNRVPRRRWLVSSLALALLALAAALIAVGWRRPAATREPVTFTITAPEGATLESWPGVPSPDGRLIAFVARDAAGKPGLWLRSLATQTAQRLPGTEDASGPFWSPDGLFLGFFAQGKLKKIALGGGPAQTICNAAVDLGATWSLSGDIVLAPSNRVPLHRVLASGGTPEPITTFNSARGENSHRWPHFLPDGRHFLFTARSSVKENTGIYVGALDSKEIKLLLAAQSNARYAPPGYLLFGREGTLMAQHFDTGKLALEGDAFPVAGGIEHERPSANAQFAVSADGSVLTYQQERPASGQLTWFGRSGSNLGSVGPRGNYTQPRLSPDGKRVALVMPEKESGNRDIWLMDVASGRSTRFTFNPAIDWFPVWSPDGAFVAFSSDRTAPASIYRKAANGSGEEQLLLAGSSGLLTPMDWSSDGRALVFGLTTGGSAALWTLPIAGERPAHLFLAIGTSYGFARYSPDGKWLAYMSNEGGSDEIYVSPVAGGEKVRVSTAGGGYPTWPRAERSFSTSRQETS